MKTYPFHALLSRMKYITRWALMRNARPESLSEHTADTALLAHALCLIAKNCTGTGESIRPDTVAAAALYHDAPEILTGDMPTPGNYKNAALRTAYKAGEAVSARAPRWSIRSRRWPGCTAPRLTILWNICCPATTRIWTS